MNKIINTQDALDAIDANVGILYDSPTLVTSLKKMVNELPPVDAVPVRHGRWIEPGTHGIWIYGKGYLECDQCHEVVWLAKGMKFCPECGAKMYRKDGDSNESQN